tara:strand:- start:25870 stop:26856 length:987 start_codon:yes stop_codon:yes gene_type:complete
MISFVIQGPTNHKTNFPTFQDGEWKEHNFTSQRCIDSIREWYPDSEIIVSCTTGDADDLTGVDQIHYVTDDMLEFDDNVNRQILSSQAVKHANNDIVCKIRSDMVAGTGWLVPFAQSELLGNKPYNRIETHKMFKRFVFTSNWSADRGMYYHPSDWFFFGLKEDVQSIFDIPQRTDHNWAVGPEQYITIRCMEKYGMQEYIDYNWLENHGNKDTHIGQNVPPEDQFIKDWWTVFFNNYCVLNTGWSSKDPRIWRVTEGEKGDLGYSAYRSKFAKSNSGWRSAVEEPKVDPSVKGECGLMSHKYLERVGEYRNLINHTQWLIGNKAICS